MRPFTAREFAINTAHIARGYPGFLLRPRLPLAVTRAYQLQRLRRLVAHALQHVDLYREKYARAGVSAKDLRSLEDLAHFPTVSKDEILAAYPEGALTRGIDLTRCIVSKSSGSTGQVLNVVHHGDRLAIQGLAMNRLLGMYGPYLPWHRHVYVYTAPYPARSMFGAWPMIFVPTLAREADIAAQLETIRPTVLACYPSHLRAIAQALGPRRSSALGLRAISVSSEPSTKGERQELARMFGCGVYDEYSTEELTRVAAQCTFGTYHLFEDVAYMEIVHPDTGLAVPEGQQGDVVGTYLHNFAMPFIRYRQGDLASIAHTRCPCGWAFRALQNLAGRKLDQFTLPSGRVLTSGWLLDASYSFLFDVKADIRAFTLIQEATNVVTVEIVPGAHYTEETSRAIRERFLNLVGEALTVQVVLKDELVRSKSGKHNPIVCRLRAPKPG